MPKKNSTDRVLPKAIFVDPTAAAHMVGCSRAHLYRHMLRTGLLPYFKSGRRTFIAIADIRALSKSA